MAQPHGCEARDVAHDPQIKQCVECGRDFQAKRFDATFCQFDCGSEFNKRRQLRGMIMYDLMMINRYERKMAKKAKVWFLLTRLCMYWRQEDYDKRDGRRSWRDPKRVIEANAWARSTVVDRK